MDDVGTTVDPIYALLRWIDAQFNVVVDVAERVGLIQSSLGFEQSDNDGSRRRGMKKCKTL